MLKKNKLKIEKVKELLNKSRLSLGLVALMALCSCEQMSDNNGGSASGGAVAGEEYGSVCGVIYDDLDSDGLFSTPDDPIANEVLELMQNGVVVATVTTDINGEYCFEDVPFSDTPYDVECTDVSFPCSVPVNVDEDNPDGVADSGFPPDDSGAGDEGTGSEGTGSEGTGDTGDTGVDSGGGKGGK